MTASGTVGADYIVDPSDGTLGFASNPIIANLGQATTDEIVEFIKVETGGVYATQTTGYIKLISQSVGALSSMKIITANLLSSFIQA